MRGREPSRDGVSTHRAQGSPLVCNIHYISFVQWFLVNSTVRIIPTYVNVSSLFRLDYTIVLLYRY